MTLQWENKPTIIALEANLDQLLQTFTELATSVNAILSTLSSGLNAVKIFLVDDINPLLLALEFILDQMLIVIENFKDTGMYVLSMYPSKETHSRWYRGNRTEKILFRDLLPGFAKDEVDEQGNKKPRTPESDRADGAGFYILQQKDAFEYTFRVESDSTAAQRGADAIADFLIK